MHLPGPFRAAVGLVASAADEVKHLPDRAVELPMLAVSTALQLSLRAQQRYARLAARGDEVLNRTVTGEAPPEWATFDEPVSADELRRAAMAQLESLSGGATTTRMFDDLFGVADPAANVDGTDTGPGTGTGTGPDIGPGASAADDEGTEPDHPFRATVTPISEATSAPREAAPARKATPGTTAAAPARKAAAKKTARKAAAKKTPAASDTAGSGKAVSKPRHTAPSKFDDAD